jgi:hypothetical protein
MGNNVPWTLPFRKHLPKFATLAIGLRDRFLVGAWEETRRRERPRFRKAPKAGGDAEAV